MQGEKIMVPSLSISVSSLCHCSPWEKKKKRQSELTVVARPFAIWELFHISDFSPRDRDGKGSYFDQRRDFSSRNFHVHKLQF